MNQMGWNSSFSAPWDGKPMLNMSVKSQKSCQTYSPFISLLRSSPLLSKYKNITFDLKTEIFENKSKTSAFSNRTAYRLSDFYKWTECVCVSLKMLCPLIG